MSETTRDQLLMAARKLFARKGFEGASVKEICEEAQCNISLVSYHFGGKESLYKACIEPFAKNQLVTFGKILRPAENFEELKFTLRRFFESILENFIENPEMCQILQRDVEVGHEIAFDLFKETFFPAFMTVVEFITQAQKSGLVRSELDPRVVAVLMFGGIQHTIKVENIRKKMIQLSLKDADFRKLVIDNALDLYLNGLRHSDGGQNEKRRK